MVAAHGEAGDGDQRSGVVRHPRRHERGCLGEHTDGGDVLRVVVTARAADEAEHLPEVGGFPQLDSQRQEVEEGTDRPVEALVRASGRERGHDEVGLTGQP